MDLENPVQKNLKSLIFKRFFLTTILVVVLAAGFSGGILFEKSKNKPDNIVGVQPLINTATKEPQGVDFNLFWDAWSLIHEKYVDKEKLDTQNLVYGAIEGMVNATGDPFTNFLKPDLSKKFREEIKGEFGGVGIEIGMRKNELTVISPIKDSPADKAGIKAGDRLLKLTIKTPRE